MLVSFYDASSSIQQYLGCESFWENSGKKIEPRYEPILAQNIIKGQLKSPHDQKMTNLRNFDQPTQFWKTRSRTLLIAQVELLMSMVIKSANFTAEKPPKYSDRLIFDGWHPSGDTLPHHWAVGLIVWDMQWGDDLSGVPHPEFCIWLSYSRLWLGSGTCYNIRIFRLDHTTIISSLRPY